MIRTIANGVEICIPPPLLYSSMYRVEENKVIRMKHNRRFLPYIVSEVAKQRSRLLYETKYARHILHRYNCDFARSIVLEYLQFDVLF